MDKLITRIADANDIDRIAELEEICFSDPWTRESVRQEIEDNPLALYIVAELDQKVVGYAGIWWIVDEGHITNVAVDPQYRGKHIGEAIIAVMLDTARKEGIDRFTLEVRVSNEPAKNLYRKFGFAEAGIRPKYYKDNEDALIMWLMEE